ncbi:IS5 family transposase [Lentibacillus cibarius]|uniref:IS5 family transposase n=1 Tax=Lentibacillus cibarius TaxID=2583219 RepID=A0A549YHS5_9BACI|nr:IS5 family transposase [Lentibacillus cibarius]TRM11407.1 IS5 family transposase [Lentibacillus cibarius]TRM11418.1 IS5 family transposase [Lentibacillus cibarius]
MYDHNAKQMILPDEFFLPFGGRLNPDNRWVVMASLIPWAEIEDEYVKRLGDISQGSKAYPVRLALGSLIIKEKLGLSDEETVQAITENPYLQYFLGLHAFQEEAPFDASSMTYFRKRFDADLINDLNERIVQAQQTKSTQKRSNQNSSDDDHHDGPPSAQGSGENKPIAENKKKPTSNQGKLLLDATCAPSDIAYPTDINLLNEAREKLEGIIDTLHAPLAGKQRKPRTYRKKARKQYLGHSKQRKPGKEKRDQAIRQQLGYVRRNLKHVTTLATAVGLSSLSKKQYRNLLVIQELYRQQAIMFEEKRSSIDDRIVSVSQPHVRPIVRGKTNARVEFGAKLSVSVVNGYTFLDVLSWDAYHEGKRLKESIEQYKVRYGHYPEAVLADTIYRTRENRAYCQERGIRLSGPKLGRPSKNEQVNARHKQMERQDASERNTIEGKFGEGKRRYGLGLISACLQQTSETAISLSLLLMNIGKILRDSFLSFLWIIRFGLSKENHPIFSL